MRNLFRRLHHGMTLEAKLIGPMVLIVLLGSAVGTVLTYVSLRREITQQYVEQARAAALILERGGRAEDLLKDRGAVSSHLNELMDMHRVSHRVTIYARTHMGYRAVASTDPLRVGRQAALHDLLPLGTGQPAFREEIEDGLPVLEIVLPVRQGGRIVATVGVYVPLAERNARLAGVIRSRVAVSILVGGTLVGLVFAIIRASVLTPLGTLMRAAERTAAGDLTADAILHGNATPPEGVPRDQVARFARVLGSLVRQIREAQARLEEQATRDPLTGSRFRWP